MKSILLSVRPQWLAKILNGEKTIEVRKKFPKDYVGWVYLYCSKDKKNRLEYCDINNGCWCANDGGDYYNGKVVARFWCNKVEEIELWYSPARADNCVDYDEWYYETETLDEDDLLYGSCLSQENLTNYLCRKDNSKGFAIHISKLEIFDKPRELSEFKHITYFRRYGSFRVDIEEQIVPLTKAPQNYCYIEGE